CAARSNSTWSTTSSSRPPRACAHGCAKPAAAMRTAFPWSCRYRRISRAEGCVPFPQLLPPPACGCGQAVAPICPRLRRAPMPDAGHPSGARLRERGALGVTAFTPTHALASLPPQAGEGAAAVPLPAPALHSRVPGPGRYPDPPFPQESPMNRLDGTVCIVTGAASGIGLRIAEVYAAAGGEVAIADLKVEAAEPAAQAIRDTGGEAMAVAMDVTDERQVVEIGRAHV